MWAGRGEVGLAGAEADDVLAGRLQGLGLGVDGQGGRGRHGGGPAARSGGARSASRVVRRHGCHDFIRARRPPTSPNPRPTLLPSDGRFGSGPSKVRPDAGRRAGRAWPRPISAPATARRRSSRWWAGCAPACASSSRSPTATRWCSATGGRPASGTPPPSGSSRSRASTCRFGEFSSKFAACAKAAPHLKDPQVIESEVGTHPHAGGRRRRSTSTP